MKVDLSQFNAKEGLNRGMNRVTEVIWYLLKMFFFLTPIPWPSKLKSNLLQAFGANVGKGVIIKPRVNIHFPWKLVIGDNVWIGEEVFILNFEIIIIESNVCISQRSFLCGGNHDYRDEAFGYRNGPITLQDGVWVGAQSFVGPNVVLGKNCVITAGSIVSSDQPENMICSGNPCKPIKQRWKSE